MSCHFLEKRARSVKLFVFLLKFFFEVRGLNSQQLSPSACPQDNAAWLSSRSEGLFVRIMAIRGPSGPRGSTLANASQRFPQISMQPQVGWRDATLSANAYGKVDS